MSDVEREERLEERDGKNEGGNQKDKLTHASSQILGRNMFAPGWSWVLDCMVEYPYPQLRLSLGGATG